MSNIDKRVYRFRILAIAEGISFLVLLLVAMPLKYYADIPEAVKIIGWLHGILFMLYIPAVFLVKDDLKWKTYHLCLALVASVVPAGPFILDHKLIKR